MRWHAHSGSDTVRLAGIVAGGCDVGIFHIQASQCMLRTR